MTYHRLSFSALLFTSILMTSSFATAENNAEKGLAIAKQQKAAVQGWKDSQSELKMLLRSHSGAENTRIIEIKSLEVADDGDKNLMVFREPKDVQGTAFLSYSHINAADDQWIYLPALKRVKRIASRTKSGSFMGSEFSYEDLASFEIEKYDFEFLRDEACGELTCHVLQSTPKDSFSGYSKLISWNDTKHHRVQKVEFYDKKGQLLKVMEVKQYQLIDDKFWRPTHSVMNNVQTKNSTELFWYNIRLNTGLSDHHFSQNNLKNAD